MHRIKDTPKTYRHRGHTIEPLSCRVCGPEGWLYWRVIPDIADNGEACWDARSLPDARETIDAELEALEAENLSAEQHASASIGGQR